MKDSMTKKLDEKVLTKEYKIDYDIYQFYHNQNEFLKLLFGKKYTVGIKRIDKKTLIEYLQRQLKYDQEVDYFQIELGIAYVHPNDQYNKEIGRQVAFSKMGISSFKLHSMAKNKSMTSCILDNGKCRITLEYKNTHPYVYLTYAYVLL